MSTVEVNRTKTFKRDAFVRYAVRLDGAVVGKLWNGRSLTANAEVGDHKIIVSCQGFKSDEVDFTLEPGTTVSFECAPRGVLSVAGSLAGGAASIELHQLT
jgi:hypothetical protein